MEFNTIISIILAYLLTDDSVMLKFLRSLSFFNDTKKFKLAKEISIAIVFVALLLISGVAPGFRFLLALAFFTATRKRLATCAVPKLLQGEPIMLITALFIGIVFFGLR